MFTNHDKIACLKRVIRKISGRDQRITDLDQAILEALITDLGGDARQVPNVSPIQDTLAQRQIVDPETVRKALEDESFPTG
jgi:protein-disulfide isomerase-like protein with CxxC motif